MTYIASVNGTALAVFGVVVGVTMIITYVASKRISTATDFWAAGRTLTGPQNGLAIAGEAGVREVLQNFKADFDLTLGLAGCTSVADIGPENLTAAAERVTA